jgi:hypothetical protein
VLLRLNNAEEKFAPGGTLALELYGFVDPARAAMSPTFADLTSAASSHRMRDDILRMM